MRQRIIFLLLLSLCVLSPGKVVHAQHYIPPDVSEEYIPIDWDDVDADKEDVDLISLVCLGEAEGESEYGKRLVIDTILNRLYSDEWPNTISEVCWQKRQFSCLHNGRCNRVSVNNYIRRLVIEEMEERTNCDVRFFSADGYNGSPLFKEGGHYFSE